MLNLFRSRKPKDSPDFASKYADMDKAFLSLYSKYKDYSLLSVERHYANYKAIEYINNSRIKGSIVECGVWKGGSVMLMMESMNIFKQAREVYLYDTFTGMSMPEEIDKKSGGDSAMKKWEISKKDDYVDWCYSSLDEVKKNLSSVEYDHKLINFVKGKVEDTIPGNIPEKIALLRLDTDWYKSTKHELAYLFPNLEKGGVLIIDDYGSWQGARKAVDEYIEENNISIFLSRIDGTGRIGIKL